MVVITSINRKIGVNVVNLIKRLSTSSAKCWTAIFCTHIRRGPVNIMHQLTFIYNSSFKNSHSHPIHTCFPMIASNTPRIQRAIHTELRQESKQNFYFRDQVHFRLV